MNIKKQINKWHHIAEGSSFIVSAMKTENLTNLC